MGCGMSMIKYLLFIFNLLCALCGIAFIAFGGFIIHKIGAVADVALLQIPIAIIVLGSIIFLISFFGCCGAIRESYCMTMTYAVVLFLLVVLDIVLIVFVFVTRAQHGEIAEKIVSELWKRRDPNNRGDAFHGLEISFQCCGEYGPTDYRGNLPPSCCQPNKQHCDISEAHLTGCRQEFKKEVESKAQTLSYVAIGVCVTEIVGLVFACCLANHVRNHKRRSAY